MGGAFNGTSFIHGLFCSLYASFYDLYYTSDIFSLNLQVHVRLDRANWEVPLQAPRF